LTNWCCAYTAIPARKVTLVALPRLARESKYVVVRRTPKHAT